MADLGNYSDKLMQNDQNTMGVSSDQSPTGSVGTSGVVSGFQGGNGQVSTAGLGPGGTGGWTNIQAYLNANKGDNGSAQNLQQKAGGLYDQEAQNLKTQADTTKSQALGEANKVNEAKDNAKPLINQTANAYSWTGNQNSDYNQGVNKLQSAIFDPYKGPQNFAYQTSNDFQKNQSAFGNDSAFNNYMNDIYKEKAGGQLTQGQGALQTQLDVNNQNLANTRANLLKQYAGFGDLVNQNVADTDAAIQSAKNQYGNNQNALKSTLQNYANDYDTSERQAEANARSGYDTALNSGLSGRASALQSNQYGTWDSPIKDLSDTTWRQLEQERDDGGFGTGTFAVRAAPYLQSWIDDAKNKRSENTNSLNNFYNEQDQKYSGTADNEKRNWNTIMDILKSDAARKKQNFQVRG